MKAPRRLTRLRLAVAVFLLLPAVNPASSRAVVTAGSQPAPRAAGLDGAIRAGDLDQARLLVPPNWAAAEALFVSYLERAYSAPGAIPSQADSRVLAMRLADVFFRIVEYDFARSLISTLDAADAARRAKLMAAARDLFSNFERRRAIPRYSAAEDYNARGLPVFRALLDVADRFRELSFPRGELYALFCMADIRPPVPRLHRVAGELGDDLSLLLVQRQSAGSENPPWDALLARAERLGLLSTQLDLLSGLGRQQFLETRYGRAPAGQLEEAVRHLEEARRVARKIPLLETVNFEWYTAAGPQITSSVMPQLFAAYVTLKQPQSAEQVFAESLQLIQPFGRDATLGVVGSCANQARGLLTWEEAAPFLNASLEAGPDAEVRMARGLAGSGRLFRPEIAEKALALAVASPDAREKGFALAWYASIRKEQARSAPPKPANAPTDAAQPRRPGAEPFPSDYRHLLKLCLEAGEFEAVASARAHEAEMQGLSGDTAAARETFDEAIRIIERTGDALKIARFAIWAATGITPASSYVPTMLGKRWPPAAQLELAVRALEAAKAAGSPLELAIAFWARAGAPPATSDERVDDLRSAVASFERHTELTAQVANELLCLALLGKEYARRGDYLEAVEVQRRRAMRALAFDGLSHDRGDVLDAYATIARIYANNLGEPALAFEAAERARQRAEAGAATGDIPSDAVDFAYMYRELASIALALGRPAAALDFLGTALQKAASPGPDAPGVAQLNRRMVLAERAQIYARLGDYQASREDWDQVQSLIAPTARNYDLADFLQRAQWFSTAAWTHALAGDLDKALALARQAVNEFAQNPSSRWTESMARRDVDLLLLTENPEEAIASTIRSVAEVLILSGHPDEAIAFCDLESIRRSLAERPVAQRIHLESLARACVKARQFDRARDLLMSAIEIDRKHSTAGSGGLARSLFELGMLEVDAGDLPKAREHLLAARTAANAYDLDQVWRIERALALVLARMKDSAAAGARYGKALDALESVREHLRPEEFRLQYGESPEEIYEAYAALLADQAAASGLETEAVRAFQAAERKRTQVLRSLLATGWSRMSPDAIPEQVRRAFEIEARMSAKRALLRQQFAMPAERRNLTAVQALQRQLDNLQADHGTLLASIAQGRYRYSAPAVLSASLAGPVRAALGPRVLVEYLVTGEHSYAFVVSASGLKIVRLTPGRAALRTQVTRLLAPFRRLRAGDVDISRLEYDTVTAHALYEAIFAPVRPHLGSASEVVIVPDDVLSFLPFEALVEKAPRPSVRGKVIHGEFAEESFLLRRLAVSYLTSSAQLLADAQPGASRPAKALLALANPTAGRPIAAPAQDDPVKRQLRAGRLDELFAPLPGAQAEVESIAGTFAPDAVKIVLGTAATETAYHSDAGQFRYVHFATHAVTSDGLPLYSTLILAPDSPAGHDGFLQAFEVLRTPLRADLVVLSACETALGTQDRGQGLTGLVAAFQQAGARSVLATLWSVDEATAKVTTGFYGALAQGRPAVAALRQAKLRLLGQRLRTGGADVSLAHPFFWAPFILVGSPPGA